MREILLGELELADRKYKQGEMNNKSKLRHDPKDCFDPKDCLDFSPAAIEQAKRVLGSLAERVILGDFFTYDFAERHFDLIYERTFLCSMTPSRWPEYVNRMADLLLPGGRLIGVFLYGQKPSSGPPFPLTEPEAEQLFNKRFELVRSEAMTDSLPLFRDMERWQEWLKLDLP